MLTKPYSVFALIEAKLNTVDELKVELKNLIRAVKKDGLALEFKIYQDFNNPAQFVLYEYWEDESKQQAHSEKAYVQALIAQLDRLLAKPLQIIMADEI